MTAVTARAGAWTELQPPLSADLLEGLKEKFGFETMTPVQKAAIPLFLSNKDVVVQACTGSGKTLAFVLPLIEILRQKRASWKPHEVGAVIVSPVRELALQTYEVASALATPLGFTVRSFIGGTETERDLTLFREHGGNIIVATPGRLDDILEQLGKVAVLRTVEVLVLDEADRLLDMGFQGQISSLLGKLPKQRRTGLFSATQTEEVEELTRAGLRNPVKVVVNVERKGNIQAVPTKLVNQFILCPPAEKFSQLAAFIQAHPTNKIIVYFLTGACVDYFWRVFKNLPDFKPFNVISIHGHVEHSKREAVFAKFRQLENAVLLCTDIAARGLDIPDVDWIVQYDPPQDPKVFVHRIGRTARMGRSGNALLYLHPCEETYIEFLRNRKVPIDQIDKPEVPDFTEQLRQLNLQSRENLDYANAAYVSFIRGYKEHHCSFIFRVPALDFGGLASGFGLLRMPRMPELKGVQIEGFEEIDLDTYNSLPYKDKKRQAKREKEVAAKLAEFQQKKKRKDRREKNKAKRQKIRLDKFMAQKGGNEKPDDDDLDELNQEARLLKKLKRGKISQSEFDRLTGED